MTHARRRRWVDSVLAAGGLLVAASLGGLGYAYWPGHHRGWPGGLVYLYVALLALAVGCFGLLLLGLGALLRWWLSRRDRAAPPPP